MKIEFKFVSLIALLSILTVCVKSSYVSVQQYQSSGVCNNGVTCNSKDLFKGSIHKYGVCSYFLNYPAMYSKDSTGENIIQNVYLIGDSECKSTYNQTKFAINSCNENCPEQGYSMTFKYVDMDTLEIPDNTLLGVSYGFPCKDYEWKERFTTIEYTVLNKCFNKMLTPPDAFSFTCNSTYQSQLVYAPSSTCNNNILQEYVQPMKNYCSILHNYNFIEICNN